MVGTFFAISYSKTALNTKFLLHFSGTEETSAEDFLNVANINELSDSSDWSISCNLNCYECGENFVGFEASVLHMSQKHTKASKVFRCISCPKSFARKDHLRNHVRRHVFIKDTVICNTKNDSTKELKQHVSDCHLDSNGAKIKKDTIEPNDTLTRNVIGDADNLGLDEFIEEEGVWEDDNSDEFEAENLGQDILNDISDGFEDEFDEYIPKIAE